MSFAKRRLLRRFWKGSSREKYFNQLKDTVLYGQQLAGIGSWIYYIQSGEVFRTEEFYNILGRSPKNMGNDIEDFYSCVHPDDIERVKRAVEEVFNGKEYDIEYRIVTPNGMEKYVHDKAKVLMDEKEKPIKVIGIIQDITKEKILESNLKELGDNLNKAQRVAGVGSFKYDVLKDEYYVSEEMYRICGIEPQDFKNDFQNALKLIHPDDQALVKNTMEKNLKGETCEIEFRILQPDGTIKYVIGKAEPIFDKDGKVVSILGTVQDITKSKLLEMELKKSHKIIAQAQALAHIGSWEMDIANNKIYWSDEAYRIFGITQEQCDHTYEGFLKCVHPEDVSIIENVMNNPSRETYELEFRIIRPDGTVRNVYEILEYVFDGDGNPYYLYGTIQDITVKRKMQNLIEGKQQEINKMQRKFQLLVQRSSDVFEIIDPDGTIKYMSEASEGVIGYKPEERIGKKIYDYYDKEDIQKLREMVDFVLHDSSKEAQRDVVFKTKSGKNIFMEVHMQNLLHEPEIGGIVVNFRDITDRIQMEKRIVYIATHDELTGLPNSVYLKEKIKLQCQSSEEKHESFALMMLDIDRFKYINDALDYGLGDQLIIQISQRLKNNLDGDKFICRYLGDQFAIIVPGLSEEGYMGVAKSIIDLFIYPFKLDKYELYITVCIGVSIYPEDGKDYTSLLKHADIALLRAKEEGGNKYKFYSSNMTINSYKQLMLRNDLHKVIEKDEIKVFFQPIVNLKTNDILAAEALIRWEHPVWGLVSPGEFVSLAEESGFIVNLGRWMLREVCRIYKKWMDDGLPAIKVSINYSSIQFFESNFVENIKNTIDEFELNPDFLIIEITESILIVNLHRVTSHIKDLQALGIQVAIDDFGTGVSCLAYLNKFNIDILKIDRSFIKNAVSDENSSIIIRMVISMAREMRIKLVAEGIENWDQLSYLKRLNCHAGQGYLYGKPVSEQLFAKVLARKKCKPIRANNSNLKPYEERRKFFRVNLHQLLEADMTILEIGGKKAKVGNTKVVIKDIGPGGLRFVSNIKLPLKRDLVLQFTTELLGKEIRVYGCPVWIEEILDQLYEYGIEFTFDENDRSALTGVLNQVQVKIRRNPGFADGRFVTEPLAIYFKSRTT